MTATPRKAGVRAGGAVGARTKQASRSSTAEADGGQGDRVGGDAVLVALARVALDGTIIGQQAARQALVRVLECGNVPHAWIVHGPQGVGKCTLAVRMAALLVDPETRPQDRAALLPRRDTRSAQLLRDGVNPDIRVIRKELASVSSDRELRDRKQLNIPLGLLREHLTGGQDSEGRRLQSPIGRASFLGAAKVFIIDGAELMEPEAQNALLKTLEEPPANTFIILCTTQPERMLPTIRSRCQSVGVAALSDGEFATWAAGTLQGLPTDELAWINNFASGSPGRAQLASRNGLFDWQRQLSQGLEQMAKGEFPAHLADAMHELAQGYAEAVVKENDSASKDAANRAGVGLVFSILGANLNKGLRNASAGPSSARTEAWIDAIDSLQEAERNVRANVNLKFVFADLVAQTTRSFTR